MKKKLIYIGIFASLLVSCTESLEDKAAREAKEYTENTVLLHTSTTPGLTVLHLIKPRRYIRTISL